MKTVLFACTHNAGRSQMAAALFNLACDPRKARALSAGTAPSDRVHPEVLTVMRELDCDLSAAVPQRLTEELAASVDLLVTMGCGENCPYVAGLEVLDWALPDPKGRPLDEVRETRDRIRSLVATLLGERGWASEA